MSTTNENRQSALPMKSTATPAPLAPESLVALKDTCGNAGQRHPVESIMAHTDADAKASLKESVYGSALTARAAIEQRLLNRVERLPGFTSSKLGLESLTSSLDTFDFGSYLPSVEEKSMEGALGDAHVDVLERRFGL